MNLVSEYLTSLEGAGKSSSTIRTYRMQLNKFLTWLRDETEEGDPRTITSIDAVQYRRYLLEEKGLKPASVNTALASIEAFCKWMKSNGYIDYNPLEDVKRIEQVEAAPHWLDKNEKYRVIRTALAEKDKRNAAIVLTFIQAGLRAAELCNLRPEDVLITERAGTITVTNGKGMKRRVIPIPKDLRKALGEYLVDERATAQWVFGSQMGEKLTYMGVYKLIGRIGEKAKVPNLSPHTLRHTYGHDLINAGISIERVALLMGHSKLETTAIYTRPSAAELQADVENLEFS